MNEPIILASASERRRKLLATIGISFKVMPSQAQEVFYKKNPEKTAVENALRKNDWCRQICHDAKIISADTVIDLNNLCITKPESMENAFAIFKAFSGKSHAVLTAVTLSSPNTHAETIVAKSTVHFKKLSDPEIQEYFSKVNPLDKAGGYDIDQYPELIIESFSGSRSNIMGLPLHVIEQWLA